MSPKTSQSFSRLWTGKLAHYRDHAHEEHREALIDSTLRFCGLQLESELAHSPYWTQAPLARRVAALLYLVDRGVVDRVCRQGRYAFIAGPEAEAWAAEQSSLAPYLGQTLELLAALRRLEAATEK